MDSCASGTHLRHVDAEALVARPIFDGVEHRHLSALDVRRDVAVDNRRVLVGQLGQLLEVSCEETGAAALRCNVLRDRPR